MRRTWPGVAALALAGVLAACSSPRQPAPAATPTVAAPRPTAPGTGARAGAPARTPTLAPSPVELGGAPAAAPTPAPLAPAGQVLLRQSGGGGQTVNLQTAAFTSPGSWDLNWSYACGSSPATGNLAINVFTAAGAFIFNPASVSEIGSGRQGTQQYDVGGTFTLTVNAVCPWSVTVATAARPTATPTITAAAPAATSSSNVAAIVAAVPSPASRSTPAAAVGGGSAGGGIRGIGRAIPTPAPVVPAAVSNPLTGGSFSFGAAAVAATSAAGSGGSSSGGSAIATLTPIAAGTRAPSAPSATSGRR